MTTSLPFTILGIDHLGLVPKDLAQARWFFATLLQLQSLGHENIPSQGVSLQMLKVSPVATTLELLEPLGGEESPLSSYLEKKGGGIHHLALRVDNISAAVAFLRAQGVQFTSPAPRPGAHGSEVIFVHPKSTGGILVELVAVQQAT
jgi:methylmalonyl-CoA/ethylmalonyl-CoA epimerase